MDSFLCQDLAEDDYEVIFVDDSSTDISGQLCDHYAERYPQVHVIHQSNQGPAIARNNGIKTAQGKYIHFVDADDCLVPHTHAALIQRMDEERLDMLRIDYQCINEQGQLFWPFKSAKQPDLSTLLSDGPTYLDTRLGYGCYPWQWLVRREWLMLHQLFFPEHIHFTEDTVWTASALLCAQRVSADPQCSYTYLIRANSLTNESGTDKIRHRIDDLIQVIEYLGLLLDSHPIDWLRRMRSTMAAQVLTMAAPFDHTTRLHYLTLLSHSAHPVFPLARNVEGKTYQRRAMMINTSPRLYLLIMHLRMKK